MPLLEHTNTIITQAQETYGTTQLESAHSNPYIITSLSSSMKVSHCPENNLKDSEKNHIAANEKLQIERMRHTEYKQSDINRMQNRKAERMMVCHYTAATV